MVGKNVITTDEQERFIKLWTTNGHKLTQAYALSRDQPIKSYNNKKIRDLASAYCAQPKIRDLMNAANDKALAKIEKVLDRYAITEEKIAEELASIAFGRITDCIEWDSSGVRVKASADIDPRVASTISEVSEYEDKEGNKLVRIKTADKKAALDTLAKYRGMMVDRKETSNVSVKFIIDRGGPDDVENVLKTATIKDITNGVRQISLQESLLFEEPRQESSPKQGVESSEPGEGKGHYAKAPS